MFLTKKNGGLNTKPKKKVKNQKALGGWQDDDEDDATRQVNPKSKFNPSAATKKAPYQDFLSHEPTELPIQVPDYQTGAIRQTPLPSPIKKTQRSQEQSFYELSELDTLPNIQCEVKLVESITEAGGIRLKPNDSMLQQFLKECKSMNISIIGSLLIGKLYDTYVSFQSKAKALYTIEYLSKKNMQYSVYFKLHSQNICDCPVPAENAENFMKIKKNVMHAVGVIHLKPEDRLDDDLIGNSDKGVGFVDPGYNDRKQDMSIKQIAHLKKKQSDEKANQLLESDQPLPKNKKKKILAGPKGPTSKPNPPKQDFDFLGGQKQVTTSSKAQVSLLGDQPVPYKSHQAGINLIDDPSQTKPHPHSTQDQDLLNFESGTQQKNQKPALTFDQLIASQKKAQNNFDFHL